MAKKTVGELIREARAGAGMTQEELAKKVENVSAADISRAERGEKDLTQAALRQIAKATGVTQKSLLDAVVMQTPVEEKSFSAAMKAASGQKNAAEKAGEAKKAGAGRKAATEKTAASKKTAAEKPAAAKTAASKKAATEKAGAARKTATKKTPAAKKTGSGTKDAGSAAEKLTAAEKKLLALYRAADAETRRAAEAVLKGEKLEDSGILANLLGGAADLLSGLGLK